MNDRKTIIIATTPVLSLIMELIGLRGDDMRAAILIENLIYAAKQLMYDINGTAIDKVVTVALSELAIDPYKYNQIFQLTINSVQDFLNTLVTYNIINDNIYVVDISNHQIILNTYSFFIDHNTTNTVTDLI